MTGLGTIINSASIIAGGLIGHFAGKLFHEEQQKALHKACGISVLFIAIAGAMEGMLKIESGHVTSGDADFVNAFVTASLTVCIGAMAIVGAIQDGILNDYSTLLVKSVLDFIIIVVMTSSMGKGCVFSAIPVLVFEGTITLFARLISPVMTETAIMYLALIGSILIFCVGINLVWGKTIRVANMLPAVVLAVLAAYVPWSF